MFWYLGNMFTEEFIRRLNYRLSQQYFPETYWKLWPFTTTISGERILNYQYFLYLYFETPLALHIPWINLVYLMRDVTDNFTVKNVFENKLSCLTLCCFSFFQCFKIIWESSIQYIHKIFRKIISYYLIWHVHEFFERFCVRTKWMTLWSFRCIIVENIEINGNIHMTYVNIKIINKSHINRGID